MQTAIFITFKDESAAKGFERKPVILEGIVPIPNIGDSVHNPKWAHEDNGQMTGEVVSRSFSYEPEMITVFLWLKGR